MGSIPIRNPGAPATDRQVNYLDALAKDMVTLATQARAFSLDGAEDYATAAQDVVDSLAGYSERGDLTKANASKAIDYIVDSNRQLKKKIAEHKASASFVGTSPATAVRSFTKDHAGVYKNSDGKVYRVYFGQQSGQMLCKEVVGSDFVYRGLADKYVTGDKLSLDEAKAWGKTTGTCIACGRRLDVPESVDAGIGPVCAGKF